MLTLNLYRHLKSTGLNEIASDILYETLPVILNIIRTGLFLRLIVFFHYIIERHC